MPRIDALLKWMIPARLYRGEYWNEVKPKSGTPKSERRPKAGSKHCQEWKSALRETIPFGAFGFRPSDFFRISDFELRIFC